MSLDVETLRESFELVLTRAPDLTRRFYDELFRRRPEARELFGRSARDRQEKMLAQALVAVLDHLEDAVWLREQLHALGAKHTGYGVTEEMYEWVGDALLATLADAAGDAWTPTVRAAWLDAYTAIAGMMMDGAAGRTLPPTGS